MPGYKKPNMPEHFKTLVVILVLSTVVFALAQRPVSAVSGAATYARRRNLWYVLTLTAFFAHSFWLYALVAALLLAIFSRREKNPPALFLFLLFVVPMATIPIPGFGVINFFFELSHARILELFVLLPAFLVLSRRPGRLVFGRTWPDRFLFLYLLLSTALYFRDSTVTDTLRHTFYLFIDIFLPYYVASRSLKDLESFRDVMMSLALTVMVVSLLGIFEMLKHWLLYYPLLGALGLSGMLGYLERGGVQLLRASVTTGQPIALGYLVVVGMGCYLYVQRFVRSRMLRRLGFALLAGGVVAPLSRGPWVGMAVLVAVFIATGPYALRRLSGMVVAAVLGFGVLAMLPGGERVINLLPFIGSTESGSIDYRKKLFDTAIVVIERNPWFGSVNYLDTPEMQSLRTGLGIIDIVNTYIEVALETGFVGLALFSGVFLATLFGIYKAMRRVRDKSKEEYMLGRTLFSVLVAILVIISTVSSISIIPLVYWSVIGMGVAYARISAHVPEAGVRTPVARARVLSRRGMAGG